MILKYIPPKKEIRDFRSDKGAYYEAKCEFCGTIFYPKRDDAKYCSEACIKQALKHAKHALVDGKPSKKILPARRKTVITEKEIHTPVVKVKPVKTPIIAIKKEIAKPKEITQKLYGVDDVITFLNSHNVTSGDLKKQISEIKEGNTALLLFMDHNNGLAKTSRKGDIFTVEVKYN